MKNYPTKNVGNASARPGKREEFKAAKGERANLADSINRVLSNMKVRDSEDPKLEGKAANVPPKKFSK